MTRAALLPLALVALGAAAQPDETSRESFPSEVELVTVDALVFDRGGDPVANLSEGDFTIFEDGQRQSIASFEMVRLQDREETGWVEARSIAANRERRDQPTPRVFAIVWDDIHITPLAVGRIREGIQDFLRTGLRPGDVVLVAPTSGGSWWSGRVPEDVPDLVVFVDRLEAKRPVRPPTRMTDWEALRLHVYRDRRVGAEVIRRYYEQGILADFPNDRDAVAALKELDIGEGHPIIRAEAAEVHAAAQERWRLSLAAIARVIQGLEDFRGRKSVLLASEGFVNDPEADNRFREALTAARTANAAVYFVDGRTPGLLGPQGAADIGQPIDQRDLTSVLDGWRFEGGGADALAADTGGRSLRNPNDIAGELRKIADESRVYYLLGYQSTNPRRDGKYRKIKVEVAGRDLDVRARKGYYAPSEGVEAADPDGLDPQLRGALDSPVDEDGLGLRMASYVLGGGTAGTAQLLVAVDVDPASIPFVQRDGLWTAALDTYTLIASRDTAENRHEEGRLDLSLPPDVRQRLNRTWIPFFREIEVPPGTYQVRVLVRDAAGARLGTVRQTVFVPAPTELHFSTPLLTDTFERSAQGTPRPIPLARRTYRAGSTLLCAVEALGAAPPPGEEPKVLLGYGVRRVGGADLASVPPQPVPPDESGRVILQIPLSLAGVAPGDYQLVLTAREPATGRQTEWREGFTVIQELP